jgi:group I intron endonuclease
MKSGVYQYINQLNGKRYVGSSEQFNLRWNKHTSDLKKFRHENPKLQLAVNKHGLENFKFEILEECEPSKCKVLEQQYLNNYVRWGFDYNINKLATGGSHGRVISKETRHKLSISKLGKTMSEEHKKKISDANKGKTSNRKGCRLSEETKQKISIAIRGRVLKK